MINCQFGDGGSGKLRHITVGGIIVQDNKILLTKRSEKLTEGGKYCVPGGFLSLNEQISDGAAREVQEETGYEVIGKELFYFTDDPERSNEKNQNVCFYFIVQIGEKITDSDWEVTESKWFDLNNLPPAGQLAFDHQKVIQLYMEYRHRKVLLFGHGNSIDIYGPLATT